LGLVVHSKNYSREPKVDEENIEGRTVDGWYKIEGRGPGRWLSMEGTTATQERRIEYKIESTMREDGGEGFRTIKRKIRT
jgi:hypothetical protein